MTPNSCNVSHHFRKHHPYTKEKKRGFAPALFVCLLLFSICFFAGRWLLTIFSTFFFFLSSLSLITLYYRESQKIRPRHFVGILFGGVLLSFSLLSSYMGHSSNPRLRLGGNTLFLITLYLSSLFFSILLLSRFYLTHPPKVEADCIIILGCALMGQELTPILKARTDSALHWYHTQIRQGKKIPLFIPSGGQGEDEAISEALAIQRYLLQKGIPHEHIHMENRSRTTKENMEYSIRIARSHTPHPRCLFSTTSYHLLRSTIWSRKAGMNGLGIGAPTKWYYWPSSFTREFIGILFATWPIHVCILLLCCLMASL